MERFEVARDQLGMALTIAGRGQDRAREGQARKLLGVLEIARGHFDDADLYLGEALEIGRDLLDPLLVAEALAQRGELRQAQGRFVDALQDWDEAREGFLALDATLDADRVTARATALRHRMIRGDSS